MPKALRRCRYRRWDEGRSRTSVFRPSCKAEAEAIVRNGEAEREQFSEKDLLQLSNRWRSSECTFVLTVSVPMLRDELRALLLASGKDSGVVLFCSHSERCTLGLEQFDGLSVVSIFRVVALGLNIATVGTGVSHTISLRKTLNIWPTVK